MGTINVWVYDERAGTRAKGSVALPQLVRLIDERTRSAMEADAQWTCPPFALASAFFLAVLPALYRRRIMWQNVYSWFLALFSGRAVEWLAFPSSSWDVIQSHAVALLHKGAAQFGLIRQCDVFVWSCQISTFTICLFSFRQLASVEVAFRQRCFDAKYFAALTSSRKARGNRVPHFRLNKVSKIKMWLLLRSYLKRKGPQRSVNTIVSMVVLVELLMTIFVLFTVLFAQDHGGRQESKNAPPGGVPSFDEIIPFTDSLPMTCFVAIWMILGVYLMRIVSLGARCNAIYRNKSVLLMEQINLQLRLLRSPQKRDQILVAHKVLQLATKLLHDVEKGKENKILMGGLGSGLTMSPVFYNVFRLMVISALSGIVSEAFGFNVRLYKLMKFTG
jgi:hypothetical protein